MLVGSAFLLVGILSFIPGIPPTYNAMEFVSHEPGAKPLDIFSGSPLITSPAPPPARIPPC